MAQTTVQRDLSAAYAGMKADAGFDRVETYKADGSINFGRAVGAEAGEEYAVRIPTRDVAALLFDADFVTSNSIIITVNGVATAAVPFNTDHDTTVDDVAAAILALTAVTSVTLTDATNNREFTIETKGVTITVSEAVTGGASQATGTPTYSSNDVFRGISVHQHNEVGYYEDDEPVSTMTQGVVWVDAAIAVTKDQTVYVDIANGLGKFTSASSGNLATGGKFKKTITAAGIVPVEINIP